MNRTTPRANQQILQEASTWFVTFRGQDVSASDSQEFHEWLKRSPEHIRAYLEIAQTYADIPVPEATRTPDELIAWATSSSEFNVVPLNREQLHGERTQTRSNLWRAAIAASIVAFAITGAWFHAERNTYSTGIGEQRSITVQDGSIVELNARSKVRIDFDGRQRNVELLRGQALFRVAKDHTRPFIVRAGETSVRAVGTQFDVSRKSGGTTVSVVEGRVAVLSGSSASELTSPIKDGEIFLSSGEQVTVTQTEARKAEQPDIEAATAWTRYQLVFDDTSLSEVLEEFNRHTRRRLVVDSPELADLRISGVYNSTSPDAYLHFLSLQRGVVVSEIDGEIHIRKE
ncbi:MAG: FecR family protein [Steroidobacter sp.]